MMWAPGKKSKGRKCFRILKPSAPQAYVLVTLKKGYFLTKRGPFPKLPLNITLATLGVNFTALTDFIALLNLPIQFSQGQESLPWSLGAARLTGRVVPFHFAVKFTGE